MTESNRMTRSCIDDFLVDYDLWSVASAHNFVINNLPDQVMDVYDIYKLTPFELTIIVPEICGYDD